MTEQSPLPHPAAALALVRCIATVPLLVTGRIHLPRDLVGRAVQRSRLDPLSGSARVASRPATRWLGASVGRGQPRLVATDQPAQTGKTCAIGHLRPGPIASGVESSSGAALVSEVVDHGKVPDSQVVFGSLIGLVAGAVVLGVAGAIAFTNDVFVMDGPDVVGINAGSLGWTLIGLMALAGLVLALATVAQVVAWIGAVLNAATRPDKTWFVFLLVLGLLGFGFVATLIYVLARLDAAPQLAVPAGSTPAGDEAQPLGPRASELIGTGPNGVRPRGNN